MRSCTTCRSCWPPGPASASSAAPGSTPTPEPRPNEVLLEELIDRARASSRSVTRGATPGLAQGGGRVEGGRVPCRGHCLFGRRPACVGAPGSKRRQEILVRQTASAELGLEARPYRGSRRSRVGLLRLWAGL